MRRAAHRRRPSDGDDAMAISFDSHKRDYYGGTLMMLLGGATTLQSIDYEIGTLTQMGPGFYPAALGIMLALTGLAIALSARFTEPKAVEAPPPEWRGWFCIVFSLVAFIVAGSYGGLVPATFLIVFISALGDRDNTVTSALVLSLIVVVISIVIFWWALDLQLPLFQW